VELHQLDLCPLPNELSYNATKYLHHSVIRDVHLQNSITFSTNSTQQSWPAESYSVKKFHERLWVLHCGVWRTCADVSEEPATSIYRVEMDRAGSSEALEQYSLNVHEPWYLRSQTTMTAHFSTPVSTSPDPPFQYHQVNLLWLVLTNHNELT